jgi:ribokinase
MRIAVVGSYGVGMTMRVARFPLPGETLSGGRYSAGPGGKGSNQAIGAARLGAEVALLTAVGDDALGRDARDLWSRESVDASHVVTGTGATMVGFILVDDHGENSIVIAPGALEELTPEHVETFRATIADAELLVVSMEIPLAAVSAALRIAHEEGTRTLLNPAPASALPPEVWPWIDVITPNRTEAPILLGLDPRDDADPADLARALRERTAATIVMTLGSRGALVLDGAEPVTVSPLAPARVVDTTGAGDAFTAALAVALAEPSPLLDAVRFASAAGAHAVTIEGVIDALPDRAAIERLLTGDDG